MMHDLQCVEVVGLGSAVKVEVCGCNDVIREVKRVQTMERRQANDCATSGKCESSCAVCNASVGYVNTSGRGFAVKTEVYGSSGVGRDGRPKAEVLKM